MKRETDVTVILDRSGSMESIHAEVVTAFNRFLGGQQNGPDDCRLTLVQFDNEYDVVYAGVPVAAAPPLTVETFEPRGATALLDAIGRTIDATGRRLAALQEPERPDRVLMAILTDGQENASTDYTRQRVFDMIATQRDVYQWAFLFLAANQDAVAEGALMGIGADQALSFAATGSGINQAVSMVSDAVLSFRSTGRAGFAAPRVDSR